jgi:hypothetical protein
MGAHMPMKALYELAMRLMSRFQKSRMKSSSQSMARRMFSTRRKVPLSAMDTSPSPQAVMSLPRAQLDLPARRHLWRDATPARVRKSSGGSATPHALMIASSVMFMPWSAVMPA